MKRLLFIIVALLFAVSCNPLPQVVKGEPLLVLEGVIEDGHFPVVLLSASVTVDTETRSLDSLSKNILMWARVTVSDGEKEVVLTGKYDGNRYPPYVYSTVWMEGESGKTYTVKASGKGMSAISSVAMPPSASLESIRAEKIEGSDKYCIKAVLPEGGYEYASFYVRRLGVDSTYLHSFLSSVDRSLINPEREVMVCPGRSILQKEKVTYYESGMTVRVKFVTMDQPAYDFWSAYDEDMTLSKSPFFPKIGNLPTNVSGGRGYWNAYGVSEYVVVIP